ncbi:PQQ-dependent sugar dehydrogenase [Oceaniglobus ichthyenteri]|uniref:PQQ-dependent sugar dehydrogenase n=1 Tax=Oceaniglobus ichthyenteri TaxID=2136177 RepID=UPI000D3C7A4B|nr:PQQ-dependent sugar dehydrogenase [Oceaniglobus ichthyenteri]
MKRLLAVGLLTFSLTLPTIAPALDSSAGVLRLNAVVSDLDEPWSLGFLPGGAMLITERDGRLLHIAADGQIGEVSGVPNVRNAGQGGLLDVMIPRDFATSRAVYLSFAKPQGRSEGTALAVGTLNADATALQDVRVIFEMAAGSSGGRHFGSRIVEGAEGHIFMTIGDRGDGDQAQNLATHNGTVIRLNRDGSVPADNPFVGQSGAQPEVWSYGHRNAQGATLDAQGDLWVVEHGARGGDEVNKITRGANYGWPVISYGRHYSGLKIGEGTEKSGMKQPRHYWDPSIAPSGMVFYSGRLWPEWQGDLFVGSLKFGLISRLDGDTMQEVERLQSDETERVRDIREGPDGALWFLSVGNGALYRVTPD